MAASLASSIERPGSPGGAQELARHVACIRCTVRYRETHYHCCLCARVFRSASAYERHQLATERRQHPAPDAKLRRLGLVQNDAGVWMKQGSHSADVRGRVSA